MINHSISIGVSSQLFRCIEDVVPSVGPALINPDACLFKQVSAIGKRHDLVRYRNGIQAAGAVCTLTQGLSVPFLSIQGRVIEIVYVIPLKVCKSRVAKIVVQRLNPTRIYELPVNVWTSHKHIDQPAA